MSTIKTMVFACFFKNIFFYCLKFIDLSQDYPCIKSSKKCIDLFKLFFVIFVENKNWENKQQQSNIGEYNENYIVSSEFFNLLIQLIFQNLNSLGKLLVKYLVVNIGEKWLFPRISFLKVCDSWQQIEHHKLKAHILLCFIDTFLIDNSELLLQHLFGLGCDNVVRTKEIVINKWFLFVHQSDILLVHILLFRCPCIQTVNN